MQLVQQQNHELQQKTHEVQKMFDDGLIKQEPNGTFQTVVDPKEQEHIRQVVI